MEYWKINTDDGLTSISGPCHHLKKSTLSDIPINPTLQYSSTPIGWVTAQPIISDLAQMTMFSMIE